MLLSYEPMPLVLLPAHWAHAHPSPFRALLTARILCSTALSRRRGTHGHQQEAQYAPSVCFIMFKG